MSKNNYNLKQKFKYAFDNLMSKGGMSVFAVLMLLFLGAIILIAMFRFIANLILPQESMANLTDQWWLSFLQIADGGSIAEDTGSNALNRVVGIIALFLGMILFSSLVAFITSQFEERLAMMRKGKSDVVEENHTLILGFGDRVLEIIRELIIANESLKSPAVVVLAEKEKDEMDDFFRDRIEDSKTTRIVCRSGSTSSIAMLRRVGITKAKSVIILNDAPDDASIDEKNLADARVLKTIMAAAACTGEGNLPPIIPELHLESKQKLALNISNKISIINDHSILAKLMVQTSRISGLALIYDHLVGFEGNEIYFYHPREPWNNLTYEDAIFHFADSAVIGIRRESGQILLNPDKKTVLKPDDDVILLAEDDSDIKFLRQKININTPSNKPEKPVPKVIEKQLIIDWSQKTGIIIDEYSKYLIEGSSIDLVVSKPDEHIKEEFNKIRAKHPTIKMNLIDDEIGNPDAVAKLKPEQYDNVIILAGDGGLAEIRDSVTIAQLLEFRNYFKNFKQSEIKTQLITEVADSENIEIIQEVGVKDFLISNRFVSKIFAQVSEGPDVLKVYEDLFCETGSEVYLKPVKRFLSAIPAQISFGDLCAAALMRNETCFGVRIMEHEHDAGNGYGIYINPSKNKIFSLKANDILITLAEDET